MRRSAPRSGRRSCEYCGTALHERAWRHQSKRCPGYADLWAMDTYVCFGENLKAHGGEAVLFSVTAPGSDHLHWDESACAVAGDHEHSGKLGCQVEAGQALLWNERAQQRFSDAQREAKRRADMALRRLGSKRKISKCLSWWELDRGAILVRLRRPLGAHQGQGSTVRAGRSLCRWLHPGREGEGTARASGAGSTHAGADVPHQPAANGGEQGDDEKRPPQPSPQRGVPREVRLAFLVRG